MGCLSCIDQEPSLWDNLPAYLQHYILLLANPVSECEKGYFTYMDALKGFEPKIQWPHIVNGVLVLDALY